MKFLISTFLIAALSLAVGLYLPWWTIAIASFIVIVFIPLRPGPAFLSGFLGVGILWYVLCLVISTKNHDLFAHKISMLIIGMDHPMLLMLVSALIGGLVAGFGALTGSFVRGRKSKEMTDDR